MIAALLPVLGGVLDKIIPDPTERDKAKAALMEQYQAGALKELESQAGIITAEARSEHWLTANWRPLTMLVFVALIAAHWLGFTPENLSEPQVLALLDIVKVGLGGYVIGRSGEKIIKQWKD